MNNIKTWVLTVLVCFISTQPLFGDFFITINEGAATPSFVAGQTATISVYGQHNEGAPITINGFTLGFDLTAAAAIPTPDGASLPSFFSNFVAVNPLFSGATLSTFTGSLPDTGGPKVFNNFDLAVESIGGVGVTINSADRVKLFDLQFDIGAATPTGTFGLFFSANALTTQDVPFVGLTDEAYGTVAYSGDSSGAYVTNADPRLRAGSPNSFQSRFAVSAVPEPSSMVLMALAGSAGAFGVWRKRRKNAATNGNGAAV